jgi:hypothetical protein
MIPQRPYKISTIIRQATSTRKRMSERVQAWFASKRTGKKSRNVQYYTLSSMSTLCEEDDMSAAMEKIGYLEALRVGHE